MPGSGAARTIRCVFAGVVLVFAAASQGVEHSHDSPPEGAQCVVCHFASISTPQPATEVSEVPPAHPERKAALRLFLPTSGKDQSPPPARGPPQYA